MKGGKESHMKEQRQVGIFSTCIFHDFVDQIPIDCSAVVIWG